MTRIRFAFVATLAAAGIMLGGCLGGGSGNVASTAPLAPQPAPGGPGPTVATTGADMVGPIIGRGECCYLDSNGRRVDLAKMNPLPDGLFPITDANLARFVGPPDNESGEFVKYSDFTNWNNASLPSGVSLPSGMRLQTANLARDHDGFQGHTHEPGDIPYDASYAAIAYRGILEHSQFLFMRTKEIIGRYRRDGGVTPGTPTNSLLGFLSIGNPSQSRPEITGARATWNGVAIAYNDDGPAGGSLTRANHFVMQGSVQIGMNVGSPNIDMTFSFPDENKGGETGRPVPNTLTINNLAVRNNGTFVAGPNDLPAQARKDGWRPERRYQGSNQVGVSEDERFNVIGQFYGPDHQEAGGTFGFPFIDKRQNSDLVNPSGFAAMLHGVFGAKKQP